MNNLSFPALGQAAHTAHQLMSHYPDYTAWLGTLRDSDFEDEYNDRYSSRHDDEVALDQFRIVSRLRDERQAGGRYLSA